MTRRDALRTALEKLPLLPGKEGEVESWVEFFDKVPFAGHDLVWARETSVKSAENELDKLVKLIRKLSVHIEGLHRTSLRAIETALHEAGEITPNAMHPVRLAEALPTLEGLYREAKLWIRETLPDGYRPKGPPGKNQAQLTSIAAKQAYISLTGEEPTYTTTANHPYKRGGRFLKFLREVFNALGIKAKLMKAIPEEGSKASEHGPTPFRSTTWRSQPPIREAYLIRFGEWIEWLS